jgi:sugar/nucleoside kinase (ribokinase family)
VGGDSFGALLKRTLERSGVDTRGLVADGACFTTLAFVTLAEDGERSFSFARKPGADTLLRFEEIDLRLIDEAQVLHFGTLSLTDEPARSAVKRAVEYAKRRGKLLSFDPNYREPLWPDEAAAVREMAWGVSAADVVKLSAGEAELLLGAGPEESAVRLTEEYGVRLAMVTMGAEGCFLRSRRAEARVRAPRVAAVDTTGAGDIFGGAAMALLLELGRAPEELAARELEELGCFACAAASLSAARFGGIPSIPDRAEAEAEALRSAGA